MSESSGPSTLSWKRLAIFAVLLATLLWLFGLVLAIRQTWSLYALRVNDPRPEANALVDQLLGTVRESCARAFAPVVETFERGSALESDFRAGWPEWLGTPVIWDGSALDRPGIAPATPRTHDAGSAVLAVVGERLLSQFQKQPFWGSRSAWHSLDGISDERVDGQHVVTAFRILRRSGPRPHVLMASLDLDRTEAMFVNRITSVSRRVSLAPTDATRTTWAETLGPEFRFWSLGPSPSFLARHRSELIVQSVVYVVASSAALLALLVVVGALVRVTKREIALSALKGSFVADVSHELKTPLSLIRMFGEMLSSGRVTSEEKAQEYYRIITRESTRLTQLIDTILDFSRIEAGQKVYRFNLVDIGEVVRQTYESYQHELTEKGFEHGLTVEDNLPPISADADAIAQTVLNLIDNAVKYTDDDKQIDISVERETRRGRHGVLISIGDRGIGIRPEDRVHLFDGFFRASDDRVRRRRGAGLGLAVVKHVVDAHDGSVDIETRLVKGSVFRIFLPENGPGPAASQLGEDSPPRTGA
ncbi:MAG: HAMP domain-containing histidine kinase [Planctomycetes bacterium]|nr:HAMP domain-containing histidine kinase [Planctomycetota bacterium]